MRGKVHRHVALVAAEGEAAPLHAFPVVTRRTGEIAPHAQHGPVNLKATQRRSGVPHGQLAHQGSGSTHFPRLHRRISSGVTE